MSKTVIQRPRSSFRLPTEEPQHSLPGAECSPAREYYLKGLNTISDREAAATFFKKAIYLNPKFAEAYFQLGLCYLLTGDRDKALYEQSVLTRLNSKLAQQLNDLLNPMYI